MVEIVGIGLAVAFMAGLLGWRMRQDSLPDRQQREMGLLMEASAEQVGAWAASQGWAIGTGIDAVYVDELARLDALVGFPGDAEPMKPGESDGYPPSRQVTFGTVLHRTTAGGRCIVADAFAHATYLKTASRGAMILVAQSTSATMPDYTLDITRRGSKTYGELPDAADQSAVSRALEAVAVPSRLRLLDGELLVTGSGGLDEATVNQITTALDDLERSLPRPPGRGPVA